MSLKSFLKGFFEEGTQQSSTRLVMIFSAISANIMCILTMILYFKTGKDYSNQCALLSGLLLGISTTAKAVQKTKE